MRNIPVSVHEGAFDQFFLKDVEGKKISDTHLNTIQDAVKQLRLGLIAATEAAAVILSDPMSTHIKNMQTLKKANERRFLPITRAIDTANAVTTKEIALIENETFAPAETAHSPEIRSVLRDMGNEKMIAAVKDAIKKGDEDVASAVLNGPTLLTGIDSGAREMLRIQWRKKRFPEEVNRVERLKGALDMLRNMTPYATTYIYNMVDHKKLRDAEAAQNAARTAAAY